MDDLAQGQLRQEIVPLRRLTRFALATLGTPDRIKVSAFAASEGYQGDNTPYLLDSLSSTSVRAEHWTGWLKSS